MNHSKAGFALAGLGIGWVMFVLALNIVFWWAIASVVTSGIKNMQNQCDQTYQIESVVKGDLFCK